MEAFRQAIRLKPDFGRAYYNLGKCLLAMGNRDAALEQYNIFKIWIRNGPKSSLR